MPEIPAGTVTERYPADTDRIDHEGGKSGFGPFTITVPTFLYLCAFKRRRFSLTLSLSQRERDRVRADLKWRSYITYLIAYSY